MSNTKLLEELKALGVHPSGRKVRVDTGGKHKYTPSIKPRSDKGKSRDVYTKSAAFYKKVFTDTLRKNTDTSLGEGDHLVRDDNMIFPPSVTRYYKLVTTKTHSYRSSQKKTAHLEELRWAWFFAEYYQATTDITRIEWLDRICNWYFILPEDIELWTYSEWAWSYTNHIAGIPNRVCSSMIKLEYDDFAKGKYGIIEFDDSGEVIYSNN